MEQSQWPETTYERRAFVPSASTAWGVRAGLGRAPIDYDSAVPPLIAKERVTLPASVVRAAEEATQELTRFDAENGSHIRSFAPVLLRSEAASSSQIENLTASARAIFSAELGLKRSRNAELIAANTRAMQAAIDLSEAVDASSILAMHEVLMSQQPRHAPGQWRDEAVWIGTRSDSPAGAEFVAPWHERVPALIDDLVAFAQRTDVSPLPLVAIAHAQFETIHPFTDGNGRTGRALAQSLLRHLGVTRSVAVPVSAGLLADIEGYHRALTAYRDGAPEQIVLAFARGSLRAVANARMLIEDIDAIRESWNDRLSARRNSNAWRILDELVSQPVITAASIADTLGIERTNAYPPLRALVEAGILRSKEEHRLGPFWRSDEILEAIDRFAERAGRRERR
ncbi:Fic family protein [Bogoriella caseilytica]|uniref:Fic family protein n=1 Tax=Bogoriella caseilytica TaxID=56055 RepID=A0A3N2BBL0_9MICO|nr:Fic family protein [Bogoriella caseilytica]ROR72454.1 Fic family protein [Bogoriella caseilytica]